MSDRRISLAKVLAIIEARRVACADAVERYVAKADEYAQAGESDGLAHYERMAATERCAGMELHYVATLLNSEARRSARKNKA